MRERKKPKTTDKQPVAKERVTAAKRPAMSAPTPPPERTSELRFRFDRIDIGGPFCLTSVDPVAHAKLLEKLRTFETMTVNEIFNSNGEPGKDYDADKLPNAKARSRLVELELDDQDMISRLRLGGKQRLYGFRRAHEFSIVWWDPEHEIWPSTKR